MYEVTAEDIRGAAYGIDIPAGVGVDLQLDRLVAKAEVRLAGLIPTLAARYAAGTIEADLVRGIVEDMVIRVVSNPKALRSIGLDDFNATIDSAVSSGRLYVTADEVALLSPRRPAGGRVGSIRIGVPAWRLPGA